MIGGVLREYRDNGEIQDLRDIDIIVDVKTEEVWREFLDEYRPDKNSFGGYKLICTGLVVDVWPLGETWAYREGGLLCRPEEYVKRLPETVFLNIDAIIYDMKRNIWYEEKYQEAMKSGVLDIVLEKNPQISLNIVRAMVLKKRYSMVYSEKLKEIIREEMNRNKEYIGSLLQIQKARYHREILSEDEMEEELNNIK